MRLVARTSRIAALCVACRFGVILTVFARELVAEAGLLVNGSLTRVFRLNNTMKNGSEIRALQSINLSRMALS